MIQCLRGPGLFLAFELGSQKLDSSLIRSANGLTIKIISGGVFRLSSSKLGTDTFQLRTGLLTQAGRRILNSFIYCESTGQSCQATSGYTRSEIQVLGCI